MITASSGYLAAVNSTSREWSARLLDGNNTPLSCEIMGVEVHKGTRGRDYQLGTMYAPHFAGTIRGYTGALMGETLQFQLGLEVNGSMEWVTICTGTVYQITENGDDLSFTAAGVLATAGDLIVTEQGADITDIITDIETLTGVTVSAVGAVSTIGLAGALAQSMDGLDVRTALQYLAGVFGGFVSEGADGGIVIGNVYSGSQVQVTDDEIQKLPDSSGSFDITGFEVVVTAGGVDASGAVIPDISYTDGTVVLTSVNPYMTQTLFNSVKSYVTGLTVYAGAIEQTMGNPLIEPWDIVYNDVNSDLRGSEIVITYNGGVSCSITSELTTTEEVSTVQTGPMSAQISKIEDKLYTIQDGLNYFWVDSSGAHVTQVPKDQFLASPQGGNTLIDSNGLQVRDGVEKVLASFGARGARVGTEGQQSFVISPDGAEVYDSEGATTFHVGANQVSVRKRMSTLNVPLPQVVGETITFVLDPPADYDLGNLSFYVFVGANGGSTWTTSIDYYDDPAYAGPGGNQGSWEVVVTDTDPTTTVVVTCLRKDATQQADQDQCWIRYWGYGPAPTFEFGFENDVTGSGGFASGGNNTVTAAVAHAEGSFNTASGVAAHAEGAESTASALAAHAEGSNTEASAESAHAEGVGTEASGVGAHAEGNNSVASGAYSHAEGSNTEASATASHASGAGTIAQGPYQTVVGVYNTAEGDGSSSGGNHLLFIVGNGTDDNNRSNALTVDWNGNLVAGGHVSDGYGNVLGQGGGGGGPTFDQIYPVGSIYMSINATNPGALFGGTWVQIEDTFLLAAGTNHAAGSTGGSEDAVVPYHRHSVSITSGSGTSHSHGKGTLEGSTPKLTANLSTYMRSSSALSHYQGTITSGSSYNYDYIRQAHDGAGVGRGAPEIDAGKTVTISGTTGNESAHTHNVSGNTGYAGTSGNATGANMPPYLAVYVWKRTA